MADHLPECQPRIRYEVFSSNGYRCETCDALRQAEQRGHGNRLEAWAEGYAFALTAARDAVAALRSEYPGMTQGNVALEEAEVAIDALRGGTNGTQETD